MQQSVTYRHITNLQTPIDRIDTGFLMTLGDYKVGRPVVERPEIAAPLQPTPYDRLVAQGIVGIYTTEEALNQPKVVALTKWGGGTRLGPEFKSEDADYAGR